MKIQKDDILTDIHCYSFLHPQNWIKGKKKETVHQRDHERSSPRPISTAKLNASRHLHTQPINLVVFKGSYSLYDGISNLGVGFTLRCFQRLSVPYIAAQPCHWHDNWCTRGTSIPVLSY